MVHTHAMSDFKHLLRSGIDACAHPTWRQTEVEPVDDELIALFKAHPNVPVMPGFWTPRHEIYGARPYWLDDPVLAETFTPAEIKALENAKTPSDAPRTWASGPMPRILKRLKAAGVRFVLGTDMGGGFSREHDPTPAYLGWSTHIEMESMVKGRPDPEGGHYGGHTRLRSSPVSISLAWRLARTPTSFCSTRIRWTTSPTRAGSRACT